MHHVEYLCTSDTNDAGVCLFMVARVQSTGGPGRFVSTLFLNNPTMSCLMRMPLHGVRLTTPIDDGAFALAEGQKSHTQHRTFAGSEAIIAVCMYVCMMHTYRVQKK